MQHFNFTFQPELPYFLTATVPQIGLKPFFLFQGTSTSVLIGDDSKSSQDSHQLGFVTGIQRWNVPVSGIYT